ncbi:MAG: cytochrome c [Pseudomonadales bacterium]|nr:cytochrome c [Pseudomonadales bacterium]
MRIEVYLDDAEVPMRIVTPPEKFKLDTEEMADGEHRLRLRAVDDQGQISLRIIPFTVHNGPAISVHGIIDGDVVSGKVDLLANAYGSRIGDEFEPIRMETPVPVPTWAWVLFLMVFAWGAGYVSLELSNRIDTVLVHQPPQPVRGITAEPENSAWQALGKQVYGNNCASCHQIDGTGLPGVFPPLAGNPAVLDEDPSAHIGAVLHGISGKAIDGVRYASPMPPFAASLTDEEIAAVLNHERTQWGNDAVTVTAEEVALLR